MGSKLGEQSKRSTSPGREGTEYLYRIPSIEHAQVHSPPLETLLATPPPSSPRCHTFQPELGGFCWTKQPNFSAYREPAFGFGSLKLLNATHAEWKFRKLTATNSFVTADAVSLDRGAPVSCANRS